MYLILANNYANFQKAKTLVTLSLKGLVTPRHFLFILSFFYTLHGANGHIFNACGLSMVNIRLLAVATTQQLNRELKIKKLKNWEKSIHLSTRVSTMLRVRSAFLSSFKKISPFSKISDVYDGGWGVGSVPNRIVDPHWISADPDVFLKCASWSIFKMQIRIQQLKLMWIWIHNPGFLSSNTHLFRVLETEKTDIHHVSVTYDENTNKIEILK